MPTHDIYLWPVSLYMSFTDISSEGFPSPTLSDMTAATIPPSPPDTVDFDAEHYWEFTTFKVHWPWIPLC